MNLDGGANLRVQLTSGGQLSGSVSSPAAVKASVSPVLPITGIYGGPYEVTPAQSSQTLSTEKMILAHNIVVNPIPSNYGLITWDGSTLTVS